MIENVPVTVDSDPMMTANVARINIGHNKGFGVVAKNGLLKREGSFINTEAWPSGGFTAFLNLGYAFLATGGVEAMYADIGHLSVASISCSC